MIQDKIINNIFEIQVESNDPCPKLTIFMSNEIYEKMKDDACKYVFSNLNIERDELYGFPVKIDPDTDKDFYIEVN